MNVILVRMCLSLLAGFFLGLERQIHRQPAGLKTHILICIGSTLLMIVSLLLSGGMHFFSTATPVLEAGMATGNLWGDPGRLAAQVVSGIGFLGGGAILRQGFNVKGLTTAATIWVSAAIGLAIGLGAFYAAGITLACALFTLVLLERIERKIFPPKHIKTLFMVFKEENFNQKHLENELFRLKISIDNIDMSKTFTSDIIRCSMQVHIPEHTSFNDLASAIKRAGTLVKMELTVNENPS
ncbi:MAG TPA: MgtC/SapB family protein [Treponema sp.]|nr:MgtC/SapB family protein [Treponema sp.]